ncbi:MAG: DMT family transporter [Paracoccaceae bacterium]
MRLLALTALVMVAFAANSLLNRAAVGGGLIDALPFALLRVLAGAVVLAMLARAWPTRRAILPGIWLATYLLGFSLAYVALDAGIGALILFAGVQVTMLAGALFSSEAVPPRRMIGAGIALAGLAGLMVPGAGAVPGVVPALLMAMAAFGWGLYSLAGRGAQTPLRDTAANFLVASPIIALAALPAPWAGTQPAGVALALVAGAITSGLGYALWYRILPRLGASRAAVAQLCVPVIALAAGALLLGETLTGWALGASGVVLAGVALAQFPTRPRTP